MVRFRPIKEVARFVPNVERRAIDHRLYQNTNVVRVEWYEYCRSIIWRVEPTEAEVRWAEQIVGHEIDHEVTR
jgi:hypothetical protein